MLPFLKACGLALALMALPLTTVAAERTCRNAPAIATLADGLLKDLDGPDAGVAGYFARDAVYLKLHYQAPADADVDALMDRLRRKPVRDGLGFAFAYYISRLGYDAAVEKIGPQALGYYDSHPYDLTLMRQLALAGKFDLVVDNLKRNGSVDGAPYTFPLSLPFVDLPPEEKQSLADAADRAGLRFLAGGLYASLPSYATWPGFLKRNYDDTGFAGAQGYYVAFSGYRFANPPMPDPRNTANGQLYRLLQQRVIGASWLTPQSALLYEYMLHFNGEPVYAKRAAMALKAAHDKGLLRPEDPMEKGWLLIYRALAKESGDPALIIDRMRQLQILTRHHSDGSAGDILDAMLAAEALGPWLKGQAAEQPKLPALASPALEASWPDWISLAESLKAGALPASSGTDARRRGMAAELLYAAGEQARLVQVIAAEPDNRFRQRLEADFMSRLDRLCDSSLYFPGDGLFLRNATVHRFAAGTD